MTDKIVSFSCPNCNAPVHTKSDVCEYCGSQLIIKSFASVKDMPLPKLTKYSKNYEKNLENDEESVDVNESLGFINLKLKLYDKALEYFEKALENCYDDGDLYFYVAISMLQGKKPFLHPRVEIDRIMQYIDGALSVESKGVYYYLKAYVICDHHERKGYMMGISSTALLNKALECGLSRNDAAEMFEMIGVTAPEKLMF